MINALWRKAIHSRMYIDRARLILQTVLIALWLTVLKETDSFFVCYVMIAVASCILSARTYKMRTPRLPLWIASCIFSVLVFCANYPLFALPEDPSGVRAVTDILISVKNSISCLVGGVAVAQPIWEWCWTHCQAFSIRDLPLGSKKNGGGSFLAVLCILLPFYLLNLYFVEYPGTLSPDPLAQIREMSTGQYSNFNSFYHTLLFQSLLKLGYGLFGDANAAVATFCTFQVLTVCAAFAWCISSLELAGVPRLYLFTVLLAYGLLPYHLAFSVTVWKDTLFGIGCLYLCTSLFRCIRGLGSKVLNYCVFTFGCFLFCLSRNLGICACLLTFLCMLPFLRSQRLLLFLMGSVTLLCWMLNGPVLTMLGVEGADYVEFISVPLQQICRVISEGRALTEEETALLSRILDLEQVPQKYASDFADPIKNMFRSMDTAWFEEHVLEYLTLWLRLGLRYPLEYATAWIDQTKGYWNGGYYQYLYSRVISDNPFGLFKAVKGGPLFYLYSLWYRAYDRLILLTPFHSIGLHSWAVGLITAIGAMKRHKEYVLCIPALTILLGLILGAPVACEFRYAYPILTCFPLILASFLYPSDPAR